jgi:hypothetical protein
VGVPAVCVVQVCSASGRGCLPFAHRCSSTDLGVYACSRCWACRKNGTRLKTAFRNVRPQQMYPTVGLHRCGTPLPRLSSAHCLAQHSASILAQIAWILYQAALVTLLAVVLCGAEHLNTRCCCSAYCCASPCARSKNEHVVVNFGGSPFKFDLEGLLAEEREQQAVAVQR